MKRFLLAIISIPVHIHWGIILSKLIHDKIPWLGRIVSLILDRLLLIVYGLDVTSSSIAVKKLSIAHPVGVLLGGNGIYSNGRVVIMGGVKFGGKKPSDKKYLELHKLRKVFVLGDNVVVGTNSVILGPVSICDNVIIAAQSLVNKSIDEPGVYAGIPVKKISSEVTDEWVKHL